MENLRIGCITKTVCEKDTASIKKIVKDCKIDLLVFPEMHDSTADMGIDSLPEGKSTVIEYEMRWAKQIGCAIVVGIEDEKDNIFNVFVNPKAKSNDTHSHIYIKHTMTNHSAFEWENYANLCNKIFQPILFHGWRIGMTICYDSNFPIFSRMYGKQGIDLIISNTWRNANKSKWFKYHKVRSIENNCFSVVTMFHDENTKECNPPTYCFDNKGSLIEQEKCIKNIYVYEINYGNGNAEEDEFINQKESINKNIDIRIPKYNIQKLLNKANAVAKNILCYHHKNQNIIFCIIKGNNILKPEKILSLLYNKKLDSIDNKCFILVNQHKHISEEFFQTQLDTVLKVRAVENLCAVILESENICRCYQCTNYKTSQVVKSKNGYFGIDLKRTHGPKHTGLHQNKKWKSNIEFLVKQLTN